MAPIVIRAARLEDVEAVLELMRRYYAEDGYRLEEGRARRAVAELVADPGLGRLWVVASADILVGYLALTLGFSLEYHGRDAFLDELYLLPEWRRRGIGTRALATAEAACREIGVHAIHLEVEPNKTRARRIYRRAGFQHHERTLLTKWIGKPAARRRE